MSDRAGETHTFDRLPRRKGKVSEKVAIHSPRIIYISTVTLEKATYKKQHVGEACVATRVSGTLPRGD